MVRHLSLSLFCILFFVVVLWLCSTLCVSVCASSSSVGEVSAQLFAPGEIRNVQEFDSSGAGTSSKKITFSEIKLPHFLVSVKEGVMVAVAEANHTEESTASNKKKVDVVAKFVETDSKDNWGEEVIKNIKDRWKTQMATKNGDETKAFSKIMASTVNADGDKICVFLLNNTQKGAEQQWDLKFIEGAIGGEKNKKTITWKTESLSEAESVEKLKNKLKDYTINSFVGDGFVFFAENKKIVFVAKGLPKKSAGTVTVLFLLEKTDKLTLLDVKSADGWYSLFQWEGEIFRAPTVDPSAEDKEVMILKIKNNNDFSKSNKPISRLRDFLKNKNNFVTATIQGNKVLFFIHQKENDGKNDVHLWMTDGSRVGYVGTVITGFKESFYGSVLYTNNELFAYHQTYNTNSGDKYDNKFTLVRLTKQLGNVKTFLNAWDKSNNEIKKLFENTATITTLTDGLVGYLSGSDGDNWENEYLYINADIIRKPEGKVESITDGFKFIGTGVGAMWPVGKERKEDQPYNFTDPGFTLLATVEIGKKNNEKTFDNSLLGLILKEGDKRIGLLCSGGNWAVGDKTHILKKSGENKCEQEETYFVGLVLENNRKLAIFVDGKKLNDLDNQELNIGEGKNIAHFYFGTDAEKAGGTQQLAKTDVTVTNVLLYNRPLPPDEIKKFKAKKREKPKIPTPPLNGSINTREDGKNTSETDRTLSTKATEKDGAEIKLCSPLKNHFTVFVLLLLVGFTLLARYV